MASIGANELDESLVSPFQERKTNHKRDKVCIITLWTLSNLITFMLGYYVKTKFNNECFMDGSL